MTVKTTSWFGHKPMHYQCCYWCAAQKTRNTGQSLHDTNCGDLFCPGEWIITISAYLYLSHCWRPGHLLNVSPRLVQLVQSAIQDNRSPHAVIVLLAHQWWNCMVEQSTRILELQAQFHQCPNQFVISFSILLHMWMLWSESSDWKFGKSKECTNV